jgi:hypothetical protein
MYAALAASDTGRALSPLGFGDKSLSSSAGEGWGEEAVFLNIVDPKLLQHTGEASVTNLQSHRSEVVLGGWTFTPGWRVELCA